MNKAGIISRYEYKGLQVDIMSTNKVLNFTNKWYAASFQLAIEVMLREDIRF